jgi:DNA-binding PucR family transcriptional regulator
MKESMETREIVELFIKRLDEIVETSSVAIWDDVESYSRLGNSFKDDVSSAVRENVAILAHVLSTAKTVGRTELEPIERIGARRAETGIPLEDGLQAYRIVSRVCWDILAEECRAYSGEALEATINIADAVLRYTDQVNSSVADAYARAQRAIVREQEAARREFLSDLLYGTDAPPDDILRRAHAFGYDLSLGYVAMVGSASSSVSGREVEVAAAATRAAELATTDPIVLQKAEHIIALIPTGPSVDLATMPEKVVSDLDGDWQFGLGGPEPGLEGIRKAYLEAREALEIGAALGLDGAVYRFDDLLLYHFLRIEPALVDRFIDQMLGEVIAYDDRRKGELMRTMDAYFSADGSVKMAGETLFAHPHTVTYRLKQIEKLTGWSLRDAEDKIRLQLALRADKLARARSENSEAL